MKCSEVSLQPQTHRAIGSKDHCHTVRGRLGAQDRDNVIVENFDSARLEHVV
jgi:hypothetical protein